MIDMIKNAWTGFKTAFMLGKSIGQEGKNKDFFKNPLKTINEVRQYDKSTKPGLDSDREKET